MVMLVATFAAGTKIAAVADKTLAPAALASAFDAAFLFCMVLEIVGVVLMLAVKGKAPSDVSDEEVRMAI